MSYKISLLNYVFDRDNNNAILFDTAEELRRFFNDKIKYVMEDVNFLSNDLITASVYFDNDQSKPLLELLNYNYAIIEQEGDEPLYFWVMSSKQDSGSNIRLDLAIDTWNTYINKLKKAYGLVERAHLSRFVKLGDKYVFNFKKDSPLFERERLENLSKIPTKLQRLRQRIVNDEQLSQWFFGNVDHFVYFYLSPGTYNFNGSQIKLEPIKFGEIDLIDSQNLQSGNFAVLAAPFYTGSLTSLARNRIKVKVDDQYVDWDIDTINQFLADNNNTAQLFAIKHSVLNPLYVAQSLSNSDYRIDGNILYLEKTDFLGIKFTNSMDEERQYHGLMCVLFQNAGQEGRAVFELTEQSTNWSFDKAEITNETEPKVFNEDYADYRLFLGGQEYLLPISKSSPQPVFSYVEVFDPDITKALLIFSPGNPFGQDSVMTSATAEDFTGFSITLDLSQWLIQDNLDLYLANNKNALQIFGNEQNARRSDFNTRQAVTAANIVGSTASNLAHENYIGSTVSLATGAADLISNRVNFEYQQKVRETNFNLTLDNMRASPDTIKKLNSNPVLINMVNKLGLYIELNEALDFEKKLVIDYLKIFGYSYSRSGDLLDFLKNRHYYNYVQGVIDELDIESSEVIKDRLRTIFSNGVRVWRGENFEGVDYSLNNIEEEIYNDGK